MREFGDFASGYKEITGAQNYKLHFHLPTGRSLLRLWRGKQSASDDISGFRQTVKEINSGSHTPIEGIEVGRGGFAIRGLAPVTSPDGAPSASAFAAVPVATR